MEMAGTVRRSLNISRVKIDCVYMSYTSFIVVCNARFIITSLLRPRQTTSFHGGSKHKILFVKQTRFRYFRIEALLGYGLNVSRANHALVSARVKLVRLR